MITTGIVFLLFFLIVIGWPKIDIVITPGSVLPGSDANVITGIAGETLTAGMCVYLKAADSRYWKADNNVAAAEAAVIGIALTGSSAGQSVNVQISGSITIGGTAIAATQFIVSAAAGAICPIADLASGQYMSNIAYGSTTAVLIMNLKATGVTKA